MWVFPNEQTNFYISPLVFPLTQLKFFYDNFRGIFQGPDIKRSPEIASLIPVIAMNLKNDMRYTRISIKISKYL